MEDLPARDDAASRYLAGSGRAGLADRLVTPRWYHPVQGGSLALLVASFATRRGAVVAGVVLLHLVTLYVLPRAYRRATGVWVDGPVPPRARRSARALGWTGAVGIGLGTLSTIGPLGPLALVAAAAVFVLTQVLGRRFDEDLREELRAGPRDRLQGARGRRGLRARRSPGRTRRRHGTVTSSTAVVTLRDRPSTVSISTSLLRRPRPGASRYRAPAGRPDREVLPSCARSACCSSPRSCCPSRSPCPRPPPWRHRRPHRWWPRAARPCPARTSWCCGRAATPAPSPAVWASRRGTCTRPRSTASPRP